jgi:hypothetical protein
MPDMLGLVVGILSSCQGLRLVKTPAEGYTIVQNMLNSDGGSAVWHGHGQKDSTLSMIAEVN